MIILRKSIFLYYQNCTQVYKLHLYMKNKIYYLKFKVVKTQEMYKLINYKYVIYTSI